MIGQKNISKLVNKLDSMLEGVVLFPNRVSRSCESSAM